METRCINKAADELYITRSPLVRVIQDMEDALGKKLFTRKYNSLDPTDIALKLYDELKPLYEDLKLIERTFQPLSHKDKIELLIDISVPEYICTYLDSHFKGFNLEISCRRVSASIDIIEYISKNPMALFYSYRTIPTNEHICSSSFGVVKLVAIAPEHISEADLKEESKMKSIFLNIKRDEHSSELKGLLKHITQDSIPYLRIKECEQDLTMQLFSITSGSGMIIVPDTIAGYFNPPKSTKINVSTPIFNKTLYFNKDTKRTNAVKKIKQELSLL